MESIKISWFEQEKGLFSLLSPEIIVLSNFERGVNKEMCYYYSDGLHIIPFKNVPGNRLCSVHIEVAPDKLAGYKVKAMAYVGERARIEWERFVLAILNECGFKDTDELLANGEFIP